MRPDVIPPQIPQGHRCSTIPDPAGSDSAAPGPPGSDSARADSTRADGQFSNEHIALLAETLTSRPRENRMDMHRVQPLKDKALLRERADVILGKLTSHAAYQRAKLDPSEIAVRRITMALAEGDEERLAKLGIDFHYAWLDDLLMAAITGAPVVGIETVGPYAANHMTDLGLETRVAQLPADERAGFILAGIFRDVFADCQNVRGVALIDDLTSNSPDRELSQPERDNYVVAIADIFRDFGAILPDDLPGKDYMLIRESELLPAVDELIRQLQHSREGTVESLPDGDVVFHPSDLYVEKLALSSNNRKREFRRRGILIKRKGRPTCHALEAASYFHPISKDILNVTMLDQYFESQQDKTYALVRALDIVTQDRYHNVFYDAERLSPELIAYALCELLAEQTRRFLGTLDRVSEWEQFDPDEYVTRNYGTRILPEDRSIINFVTEQLANANLPLASAKLVADIGSGPNLYPAMILAPYVAADGAIDLIEYGSANRSYIQATMLQTPVEHANGIWNKYEELMIGAAGDHYLGCLERTCQLGNSIVGSVFSLPRNRYDIVSSYFVSESITNSRREFRLAVRSLAAAVKPDGILIVAHMVGSQEYHAGAGTHFPAVELSVEEISAAYRDADLTFTLSAIEQKATKARDGYQGMTVVIARHAT